MSKIPYNFNNLQNSVIDNADGSLPSEGVYSDGKSIPVEGTVQLLRNDGKRAIISSQHSDLVADILLNPKSNDLDFSEAKELLVSLIAFHGNQESAHILQRALEGKIEERDPYIDPSEKISLARAKVYEALNNIWPSTAAVAQKVYNTRHGVNVENRVPLYRDKMAYSTKVLLARIPDTPAGKKRKEQLQQNFASAAKTMFKLGPRVQAAAELKMIEEGREAEQQLWDTNNLNPIYMIQQSLFEATGGLFGSSMSPQIREARRKISAERSKDIWGTIQTEGLDALFSGGIPSERLKQIGSSDIGSIESAITGGENVHDDPEKAAGKTTTPFDPVHMLNMIKELENRLDDAMGYMPGYSKKEKPDPSEPISYSRSEPLPKTRNSLSSDFKAAISKRIQSWFGDDEENPQYGKGSLSENAPIIIQPEQNMVVSAADAINSPGAWNIEVDSTGHQTLDSAVENLAQLAAVAEEVKILKEDGQQGNGGGGGGGLMQRLGRMFGGRGAGAGAGRAAGAGRLGLLARIGLPFAAATAVVGGILYGANELFRGDTRDEIDRIEGLQREGGAPGSDMYGVSDVERAASARYAERMRLEGVTPPTIAERIGPTTETPPESPQAAPIVAAPPPVRPERPQTPARTAVADQSKFARLNKFEINPNVGGLDKTTPEAQVYY